LPHNAALQDQIDTGALCLALVARLHGLPADEGQLKHQFAEPGKPLGKLGLLRASKRLGLKVKAVQREFKDLARLNLPALARHRDGHWFVVAAASEDKVLVQDPLEARPLTLPRSVFEGGWNGELILCARRGGGADTKRRFGFSWFMPLLVKYRRLLSEVLVASFFIQLFALITPLFFQVVIDKVLVHRGLTTLDVLALGLLLVSLFEVVLGGLRTYVFSHTTNRIDVELGTQLFRHLLALPLGYFEARRVGDSVARVRELENIRNFITGSAVTVVIDLFFTVVFFAAMYAYSPLLTWVVLGTVPCYIALSVFVTPVLRARLHEKFNRGAENQAFLVETISGIETVKAMAVEPQMHRRFEDQLASYVHSAFRTTTLGNISGQIASFINKVMTVLILWVGARLVIAGDLSVGQLVAFNMLATRVAGPMLRLVQLWQDVQQAGISVQRLGDILNSRPEPRYNPNRSLPPGLQGRVAFEHVRFRYRVDGPEVLSDLSFEIGPGQMIGIVGHSGSGKSTLTKLIQRLYVPETGRILVDGMDLALIEPAWLRRQVGVVLQESMLFNRSVRENIALIDPAMPMERIIEAAKIAGAHEFILELPEGYDTVVGEHGTCLSGGQRQRIAIARALVTQPRILIFDEATSSLDYESERIVQQNMRAIAQGRTVFLIAHRLSTVCSCDRILFISRGRITEQGTHDELMRLNGQYAKLYALQSAGIAAVG
jgi:subfamily B ATP-binding cassette protein HlyB/CyaB